MKRFSEISRRVLEIFRDFQRFSKNFRKESISKKGKKAQTPKFDDLTMEYLKSYLSTPTNTVTDKSEKQKKSAYYVEGLLKNGGPSTDVFKKSLGVEKTTKLFRKILFGTTV